MRVFVALEIEEGIRRAVERFVESVSSFAPGGRWVRPESLHVTLKFIGEKRPEFVEEMKNALGGVKAEPFEVGFRGFGFFPNPKSARAFWIGIESGPALADLARQIDVVLGKVGVAEEGREYRPHLTLARGGNGSGNPRGQRGDEPNKSFQELQRRLPVLGPPEFGTMTAQAFFLYQSQLGRGGPTYSKLAEFRLG